MSNSNGIEKNLNEGIEQDFLLTAIVGAVDNSNQPSSGITLMVGGLIVAGQLVPYSEYLLEFSRAITASAKLDENPFLKDLPEDTENLTKPPTEYIHLKNPKIVHPVGVSFIFGKDAHPYCRFKLAAVDGFILGSDYVPDER
jgi:hypothetical protein